MIISQTLPLLCPASLVHSHHPSNERGQLRDLNILLPRFKYPMQRVLMEIESPNPTGRQQQQQQVDREFVQAWHTHTLDGSTRRAYQVPCRFFSSRGQKLIPRILLSVIPSGSWRSYANETEWDQIKMRPIARSLALFSIK
jgi:hypothetical protein